MKAENKLIFSRPTALAFVTGFIRCALLLIGVVHSWAALAQEIVVMDLPLPPPANSGQQQFVASTPTPAQQAPSVDSTRAQAPASAEHVGASERQNAGQPSPLQPTESQALPARVLQVTMRKDGSMYRIFRRHGLSEGDLLDMTHSSQTINRRLRRLRPGQEIRFDVTERGNVIRLILVQPGPRDVVIEKHSPRKYSMREVADSMLVRAEKPLPQALASSEAKSAQQVPEEPLPLPISAAGPAQTKAQSLPDTLLPTQDPALVQTLRIEVKPGDSLSAIFKRAGLSPRQLAALLNAGKPAKQLRRLRPGQELTLVLTSDHNLQSMTVELDDTRTLNAVRRDSSSFVATIDTQPLERRVTTASAVIEDALFLAGQRAGLSDRLIMEMVEIFAWDVDFALDVRAGDRFIVIYEELFKNGKKVRDGKILASEFDNRGRSIRALRYTRKDGGSEYFSPEGFSMRKAFLRTPVNFSRISSKFNRGRMHPVLQRMRAHNGVDYAAASGTPIRAAGNGRVTFAGRKGGYGKTVVLQHGGTYTTLYAHMSRIHARAKVSKHVKQGEIIGYVGKSGLATGPHLHYEFRVRGVHKDPLRVKLPKALPIDPRYKNDFVQKTRALVSQLDVLAKTSIASRD